MSFLPGALAAWRGERPTRRAVVMRDGAVTIQETIKFQLYDARFDSLDEAERAIVSGTMRLLPALRTTRARRRA